MGKLILVMLGPPGSGKGTQAAMLSRRFLIPSISTGEMLRSEIQHPTSALAEKVSATIRKGELVSDELVTSILQERLKRPDCQRGVILDGYPRSVAQAHSLDMIRQKEIGIIFKVIYLKVERAEIIKRLSGRFICSKCKTQYHKLYKNTIVDSVCDVCGSTEFEYREDDTPEAVGHRLDVYDSATAPLIAIYKERGDLIEIDGMLDVVHISDVIIGILSTFVKP